MNEEFLRNKYYNLKQNKILFEKLQKKSKSVKDIAILKNNENYSEESLRYYHLKDKRWSEVELIYLVYSVSKYGTDWEHVFSYYITRLYVLNKVAA